MNFRRVPTLSALLLIFTGACDSITRTQVEPRVYELAAGELAANAVDFQFAIHGEGFRKGAQVHWNGVPVPTTLQSATELLVVVPPVLLADTAAAAIRVSSGGRRSEVSLTPELPLGTVAVRTEGFLNVGLTFSDLTVLEWCRVFAVRGCARWGSRFSGFTANGTIPRGAMALWFPLPGAIEPGRFRIQDAYHAELTLSLDHSWRFDSASCRGEVVVDEVTEERIRGSFTFESVHWSAGHMRVTARFHSPIPERQDVERAQGEYPPCPPASGS